MFDANTYWDPADRSYARFWILPAYKYCDGKALLSGARIFECFGDDGVYITVQERSVDESNGELWVGPDAIGRPMRKLLRHWDGNGMQGGGVAYFLPKPAKRNEIAQQWTGRRLLLGKEWGFR